MTVPRSARALPFSLHRGVPLELVRALDRGDAAPEAWRAPVLVVIFSSRAGDRLLELGRADDFASALQLLVASLGLGAADDGSGDPDRYPLADPEVLALARELRDPALRELCLLIDNTLTARTSPRGALYLGPVERQFAGQRLVVGWEATGPMVDFAWAFLVPTAWRPRAPA